MKQTRWTALLLAALLMMAAPACATDFTLALAGETRLGLAIYNPQQYEDDDPNTPDKWTIDISYNARGQSITVQLPPDGPDASHYDGKPVWFTLDEDAPPGQGDAAVLRDIEIAGTCYIGIITAYSPKAIELEPFFMGRDALPPNSAPIRATITPETLSYFDATAQTHEISIDTEGNVLEIIPNHG